MAEERVITPDEFRILTHDLKRVEVTSENLLFIRQQIGELREQKGFEREALEVISAVQDKALAIGAREDVAHLYWERHLVNQHLLRYELDKPEEKRDQAVMDGAIEEMEKASTTADGYITVHGLDDLKKDSHRYLGKVATFKGDHATAQYHYEQMARLYGEIDHPRVMEANAALAGALIMQGKVAGGMGLARRTYREFDETTLGKDLKKESYSTWAVWKSGAAVHVAQGLLELNRVGPFKEALVDWLQDALKDVSDPRNEFPIRIGEIQRLIERVKAS